MNANLKAGLLWSFATSAVITAVTWLLLGKDSPLNHGISPDVYDKPFIMPFVLANLPAGIVFFNIFGKLGPEWGYYLLYLHFLSVVINCRWV